MLSIVLLEIVHLCTFGITITQQIYLRSRIGTQINNELQDYSPLWKIRSFPFMYIKRNDRDKSKYSVYVEFCNTGIESGRDWTNAVIDIKNGEIVDSNFMLSIMRFEMDYSDRNDLKQKAIALKRQKKLDALGI